jgi:esterase
MSTEFEDLSLAAALAGLDGVEVVLPTDRELELRGLRCHYLDWGGEGPPVLFLHGGLLTAHTWDLVCLGLRDRYRCLAPDLRGHGDSDWAQDGAYELEEFADDVAAFVLELGLERPVLVGQSLGALAALWVAAGASPSPRALVLIDIGARVRDEGSERLFTFAAQTAGPHTLDEFLELAQRFNRRRNPALLRRSLLHNVRPVGDGRYEWKYDGVGIGRRRQRTQTAATRIPEFAKSVTCPTLVVRGGRSEVVDDDSAGKLADALPDGRLEVVADAGHNVQGDQPRALTALLGEFLAACA